MNEGECKALLRFAQLSKEAKTTLDELDGYIKIAAESIMPNITYITDAKIAAELLSKAGSLERLATMPASTLQLLGAEKALFKHLKFGSKPPKYGVLFKLQEVSSARKEFRGRIARVYATKLSIASRADAFSKRFIAKELKEMIEKTIKNMRVSKTRPKPWENKAPRRDWGNKNQKSSWSDRPQGQRGPRTGGQPQNFRPRERPNNFRPKN
jgi:nucleolar protein 56